MMKRRAMFSALLAPLALFAKPEPKTDSFEYKGFKIHWSGWIARQSQDRLVGYWIAKHADPKNYLEYGFYATTTGVVERFSQGYEFNVTQCNDWPFIDSDTPKSTKEKVKQAAREALLKSIDYNLEKGADAIQPKYLTFHGVKIKTEEYMPKGSVAFWNNRKLVAEIKNIGGI